MEQYKKVIEEYMSRLKMLCSVMLGILKLKDSTISTDAVEEITYSPKGDTFYLYIKDKDTGFALLRELSCVFHKMGRAKDVGYDAIGTHLVIEINYNHKDITTFNEQTDLSYLNLIKGKLGNIRDELNE